MNSGKVLLGVLAGVATGALLGVLFAPGKGSRTRRRIKMKGENYAEGLKDRYNELIADITSKFERVKEDVNDLAEQAKATAEEAKEEMKTVKG
ncbi:MAG: YtxH domain-containing protein [Bacteroidota bacterium]